MKTITLTDKQYEKLVDIIDDHHDKGPVSYGWTSPELDELSDVINGRCLCHKKECDECKERFGL